MGNQVQADHQTEEFQAMSDYTRDVYHRFISSYGVRTSLLQFFNPIDVAQAQILSKRCYEKWIAEVQTRVRLSEPPFLFYFDLDEEGAIFGYFDMARNKLI